MTSNLTIIGFGVMGQLFARELKQFFNVSVCNRSDKSKIAEEIGVSFTFMENIESSVKNADVVIICLPIPLFEEKIREIKDYLKEDALVMDVCSVKEMPMRVTGENLKCDYIGTHPLFGGAESLNGQKIVLCPREQNENYLMMKGIFEKLGASAILMEPLEHDDYLGKIQGITHFIGLNLIEYLNKEDKSKLEELSTPTFNHLLQLIRKMGDNSPDVFLEIQKSNKFAKKSRKEFLEMLNKFDEEIN